MKNTIVKDTIVLFLITLIAGLALGLVHEVTLEPIAAAQEKKANDTYRNIFPEAETFESTDEMAALIESANADAANWGYGGISIDDCLEAKDASGNVIGYVVNATSPEGYGGDVQISAGISIEKELRGLGFLSISETPGLGMKATEPEFRDQFAGKDASTAIERIKTGTPTANQFMAVSGATYTSTAVGNALNGAIKFVNDFLGV